MFLLKLLRRYYAGSLLPACAGLICVSFQAVAWGQTSQVADLGEVSFHLTNPGASPPVKIAHVFLGEQEIQLDTPVSVKGEWGRNLRVVVQNVSPKAIVEGGIVVLFPETGDGTANKPLLNFALNLGRYPKTAFIQSDGTDRAPVGRPQRSEENIPRLIHDIFGR
jgi:hypothetical protein